VLPANGFPSCLIVFFEDLLDSPLNYFDVPKNLFYSHSFAFGEGLTRSSPLVSFISRTISISPVIDGNELVSGPAEKDGQKKRQRLSCPHSKMRGASPP